MTGTNEQRAEERIGSRLPLQVTRTGLNSYGWIGWILLIQLPLVFWQIAKGRPIFDILWQLFPLVAGALLCWLVLRFAATKWGLLSGFEVVATEHALEFRSDGVIVPYIEIQKIEMYTNRSVWMFLHDGREVSFSIAGLSKKDRPLLLAWLQRRIGADVFA